MRQDLLDQEREQKAASYDKDDDNGSRPRLHVEKSDVEKDIDHSVENASLGLDTSNNISNPKLIEPAPHATKRKVSRVAPFADEDNTEKGSASRKFVPISYSAEEMRVGVSESKVQQEIQSSAVEQRKRLIALVPKTKEDIFSYEIKWNLLDEAPDTRLGLSGTVNFL